MFERYTDEARRVIFFARYEASRLHAATLEPDHLWLGLLRQNKRLIKRLAPHITQARIEARIPPAAATAQRISLAADMQLDDRAKGVFAAAIVQADKGGNRYITSEYLVNALLAAEAPSTAPSTSPPVAALKDAAVGATLTWAFALYRWYKADSAS